MRKFSKLSTISVSLAGFGLAAAAQAIPMGSAMVGGLLQTDYANFAGDKRNVSKSSGEIRRANIWVKGNLTDDWSYQIGYDARYSELGISWMGYNGFEPFWLAFGYIQPMQSLDFSSGYTNSTFMEYASPVQAFQPPRGIGLYADAEAAQGLLSYQLAVYVPDFREESVLTDGYADAQGVRATATGDESDEFGYAARFVLKPQLGLGDVLHLGASVRYEGVSSSTALNPMVTTPNMLGKVSSNNGGTRNNVLVQSVVPGAGTTKGITVYGVEAATLWGPLVAQAEFLKMHLDGRNGNSSLSFPGWYAQASYVVTGEVREYDSYSGTIGSVASIDNSYGAWEVAFRYGYVDLSDNPSTGYTASTKRGKQKDYTLGLNWYITDNVRFLANYSLSQADYAAATGTSDATVKAMGLRGQVDF